MTFVRFGRYLKCVISKFNYLVMYCLGYVLLQEINCFILLGSILYMYIYKYITYTNINEKVYRIVNPWITYLKQSSTLFLTHSCVTLHKSELFLILSNWLHFNFFDLIECTINHDSDLAQCIHSRRCKTWASVHPRTHTPRELGL